MKMLICDDPPNGTERSWNGLRQAGALARRDGVEVRAFLLGDTVGCAVPGHEGMVRRHQHGRSGGAEELSRNS